MNTTLFQTSKHSILGIVALAITCPFAHAGSSYNDSTNVIGGTSNYGAGSDVGAIGGSSAYGSSSYGAPHGAHIQSETERRAMARLEEKTQQAMAALERGRQAYNDKRYEDALREYKSAMDTLPRAPITDSRRAFIVSSVGEASVAVAQQYAKVGRYDEARALLQDAIKINPNNQIAKRELAYLDDPVRNNPARTPQYVKNVEEVNRLLRLGYGFYDNAEYDKAKGTFEQVLVIDPYNIAARRGLETTRNRTMHYYNAAYDERRAEALEAVAAAWERPVPIALPDDLSTGGITNIGNSKPEGTLLNEQKLKSIMIPKVDLEDVTLEEAIQWLRGRAIQLDNTGGANRGLNFDIQQPQPAAAAAAPAADSFGEGEEAAPTPAAAPAQQRFTIKMNTAAPLAEVLKQICEKSSPVMSYRAEEYLVVICPASEAIMSEKFIVPPNFTDKLKEQFEGDSGDGGGEADPFATAGGGGKKKTAKIQVMLPAVLNVPFPAGSVIQFNSGTSVLTIKSTSEAIDAVRSFVDDLNADPEGMKQVEIVARFIEINQENTEELGFDWVVTPFSANNGRTAFVGGGSGASTPKSVQDFVGNPGNEVNWPINTAQDQVNGLMTGGNRSGNVANQQSSLDSLLQAQNRSDALLPQAAPGILSMTGIYNEGAIQMIMRGLSQKKGTDMLTAPSIVATYGTEATIEIIREFFYPDPDGGYEPPQLPQNVGNNNNNGNNGNAVDDLLGNGGAQVNSFPVTPATPTRFTTRNVGVTLKVNPENKGGKFIKLNDFTPEIVEFDGFVNYGSPIQSTGVGSDGKPVSVTLTDNRIEMPIFTTRRVNTSVYVQDGYTVALGGLISENVQKVEDKVPIFGDLPLIGRLFRSNSESHVRKNLMIFATCKTIDATGKATTRTVPGSSTGGSETAIPAADGGLLPDPIN